MPYGTIKVDTITFTDAGVDKSVTISGLVQNPTFSGNITVTGTVSGDTIQGQTVSGATVTGGTAAFTTVTGGVATITSGVFALGSASNPSISFTGDANSGLYSPGADQVAISTGGSGRLFVDASGAITNSLSSYLAGSAENVFFNTANYRGLTLNTATSAHRPTLSFRNANGAGAIAYIQGDGQALAFGRAGQDYGGHQESLRITSAGLVGVGTSTPATNLHIGSGAGGSDLGLLLSRGATTNFFEAHDGTKNFIAGTDSSNAFVKVGSLTNHPVAIVQSNAEAIYIDTSKRVGIGTTSPGTDLDVNNSGANCVIRARSGSTYSATLSLLPNGSGSGVSLAAGGDSSALLYNQLNSHLAFGTNNTERARIDSSGRLLVGTSSNSGGALLQVNGDRIRIATAKTPASATDTGTAGEICWDASYIYVCTATNTWKRTAISTW